MPLENLTLRRLVAEDVDAFRALRLKALSEHPRAYLQTYDDENVRPRAFHAHMVENNIIMGAFLGYLFIGYTILSLNQHAKMKHKGMVWGAYVRPAYRNYDLGKQMRLRLFEVAKEIGLTMCTSSIIANNDAALKVHQAVGYLEMFREKDGVRHLDGTFDDLIHLVKYL